MPILTKYIRTGTVTKMPSLIVICFVILTAIVCWFSGIILSTLVQQHKQNFELQLTSAADRLKDLMKEAEKDDRNNGEHRRNC